MFVFVMTLSYADASDNYTALQDTPLEITAHSTCRRVTNVSATGASVYVPTQTTSEWQSFYTNPPEGVTAGSCVTPGSQTYSTAGTYSFTIPNYNSLTVRVWGAGGGGGFTGDDGNAGGVSRAGTVTANGGGAGRSSGAGGAGGTASGGTTNTTGDAGGPGREGGSSPNGGSGGAAGSGGTASTCVGAPHHGGAPGGGGAAGCMQTKGGGAVSGGGGGGGGYSTRTYTAGDLTPGVNLSITVGTGGAAAASSGIYTAGRGAAGRVTITWN
jgi:hypothetical protein